MGLADEGNAFSVVTVGGRALLDSKEKLEPACCSNLAGLIASSS